MLAHTTQGAGRGGELAELLRQWQNGSEEAAILYAALEELSDEYREVVLLRHKEQLTFKDIDRRERRRQSDHVGLLFAPGPKLPGIDAARVA